MLTAVAELELGERMILESVERYGVDAVLGAMTYVTDARAERMAVALAALPDGDWIGEDAADCDAVADDEEYRVRVRIVKRGARAEVDFSGTSRQARSAMNATPLDAKTSVGIAFKSILDPRAVLGGAAAIDIVLPEGTVISALPPDGAVFAYWEQNQVILSAMLRALHQAVGRRASPATTAAPTSTTPTGSSPTARRGSRRRRSAARSGPTAPTATATRTARCSPTRPTGSGWRSRRSRRARPVVVLRHEIVPDTAGPGRHRGGASMLRDSLWLRDAQHHLMSLRYKHPPGSARTEGAAGRPAASGCWVDGEATARFASPAPTPTPTPGRRGARPADARARPATGVYH